MSGWNCAAADESRPPGGPDADAVARDGPRTGRVMIEVESAPEAATIFVRGELDLVTTPFLAVQLTLVSRDKPGRLVFDLAGTGFMDCGSARLIACAGEWLPEGRRPVIRRPGPAVRRILELTGLGAYCEIEGLGVGSIRTWPFAEAKEDAGAGG
jgi:anti-anti-sigma factor